MKKRKYKTVIPQKKTYQKESKKMLWGWINASRLHSRRQLTLMCQPWGYNVLSNSIKCVAVRSCGGMLMQCRCCRGIRTRSVTLFHTLSSFGIMTHFFSIFTSNIIWVIGYDSVITHLRMLIHSLLICLFIFL